MGNYDCQRASSSNASECDCSSRQLLKNGDGPGYEREARDMYGELRQTWERGVDRTGERHRLGALLQAIETQKLRKAAGDLRTEDIEKVEEEMSSKFMHDPPGNVSRERPPGPDIIEADIKKLDDWAKECAKGEVECLKTGAIYGCVFTTVSK